jgi:hypothetical protein
MTGLLAGDDTFTTQIHVMIIGRMTGLLADDDTFTTQIHVMIIGRMTGWPAGDGMGYCITDRPKTGGTPDPGPAGSAGRCAARLPLPRRPKRLSPQLGGRKGGILLVKERRRAWLVLPAGSCPQVMHLVVNR